MVITLILESMSVMKNQTLYHHMTVSMIPKHLNQIQDRIIKVEGGRILITSKATTSNILWKRAESNRVNLLFWAHSTD